MCQQHTYINEFTSLHMFSLMSFVIFFPGELHQNSDANIDLGFHFQFRFYYLISN